MIDRRGADIGQMVGVDEALAKILDSVVPLSPVDVSLLEAEGMVLTNDIIASEDIPVFNNSAMDGYAVRSVDLLEASPETPVTLRLVGNIAAGLLPSIQVGRGEAARIMTGAMLPVGADTVVRFEETDEPGASVFTGNPVQSATIGMYRPAEQGEHVRLAGEDVARGSMVLTRGTVVRASEIGLMAALNLATVSVHRRPRVAILATGDEIIDIGASARQGQVRNSNSYMLAAMATKFGAVVSLLGVARDTSDDLIAHLTNARECDLIVTSGGVSSGDYDIVKDVIQAEGEVDIWQVRMKPGKPLAYGQLRGVPLLGLPGNPAAASVGFEQFGRPVIKRMMGRPDLHAPTIAATLTERIDNHGRRRHFVRARVEPIGDGEYSVRAAGKPGAGSLMTMARANGLLVLPEHVEIAEPGMRFNVQMTD